MAECLMADGYRLHYQESGTGPELILLHGWGMSRAVFAEVTAQLERTCRCLVVDLPGHGASPELDDFRIEALADLLAEFILRLQLSRPLLLGWSLGGMVALQLAAQLPERLSGLVLVSTTPKFVAGPDWLHGLPPLQLRALRRDLQRYYARTLGNFFQLMFADNELPRERFREIVRFAAGAQRLPDETSLLAGLELLQQADLREQLARIKLPSLVVHGEADQVVPAGAGIFLVKQLINADLALLPQVGHAPFMSQLQPFCRLIESFIHDRLPTQP